MMAPTTDKKKGLLRSLFRLGKLSKRDSKPSLKQAAPNSVIKQTQPMLPKTAAGAAAGAAASQNFERDVDTLHEPA